MTKKQLSLLKYIQLYCELEGLPPTTYEMADYMKVSRPMIYKHLRSLMNAGYIQKANQDKQRRYTLTEQNDN